MNGVLKCIACLHMTLTYSNLRLLNVIYFLISNWLNKVFLKPYLELHFRLGLEAELSYNFILTQLTIHRRHICLPTHTPTHPSIHLSTPLYNPCLLYNELVK